MEPLTGFEPMTYSVGDCRSIPLSYRGKVYDLAGPEGIRPGGINQPVNPAFSRTSSNVYSLTIAPSLQTVCRMSLPFL